MRRSPADRADLHVAAQVAAEWAKLDAAHRAGELAGALQSQDRAFLDAMREMQAVRDFVGSPENILGSTDTKHGEIAEQVHVGVRRALDVLYGRAPAATFDGVPRTGPVDYRVDSVEIQSKYYNGLRNTLEGVAKHAERYPNFAGTRIRYHIPSDLHRQLDELHRTGEIEGLSGRQVDAIRRLRDDLEQTTGRSANDLIEPGEATYAEVQQGRVHGTIGKREDVLDRENKELKRAARAEHGPSLAGLGQAAALGASCRGRCRFGAGDLGQVPRGQESLSGGVLDAGLAGCRSGGGAGCRWWRGCGRCSVHRDELHCPGGAVCGFAR